MDIYTVPHHTSYQIFIIQNNYQSDQSDTIRTAQYVTIRLWLIQSVPYLHKIWDSVVMKTKEESACYLRLYCAFDGYQTDALLPWRQRHYISPKRLVPDWTERTTNDRSKSPHLLLIT